jgi:dTDP-4-dehydrorhamnose reductase
MSAEYLVLGLGGQLGNALEQSLGNRAHCVGIEQVDFCDTDFIQKIEKIVAGWSPKALINAAAYTQVDKAEKEGRALSERVNAEAVGELARWCRFKNIPMVHVSTDYVFDGTGDKPWQESDLTNPLSAYGTDKLESEKLIRAAGSDHLIFRTSWLYDAHGSNFFNTMLRLMSEREVLRVVADQVGAPTYVPELARCIIVGLEKALGMKDFPNGIFHLCNQGETSWHGFASAIFALASKLNSSQKYALICKQVLPISTAEYPTPAKRPLNSRLDCSKAKKILGITMDDWQAGLAHCFNTRFADADTTLRHSGSQNH